MVYRLVLLQHPGNEASYRRRHPLSYDRFVSSAMLKAFKIKPFDLEPIYASWTDAPHFVGKPKKDLPVDEWLAQIKAGCVERKVPKEYWHKVAQHYLGSDAKKRFDELRMVMKNMHGGKYRWNWKNFKVAMRNMGCASPFVTEILSALLMIIPPTGEIDAQKTEAIKVESKPSGLWWVVGRGGDSDTSKNAEPSPPTPPRPLPKSRATFDFGSTLKNFPTPKRSATMNSVESVSSSTSSSSGFSSFFSSPACTPASTPAMTPAVISPASTPGGTVTTVTQAPLWLSLEFLTNEHPKVMTAISAILITVGTLPALPAISAGAGGAFLASGTAHALGSLAVGLGTILKAQASGQVQTTGDASRS
ncbi:hypothetical protein A0H81_05164 [Grifola frondosa]|uniref:Uncharacterized protein n=1 Tax=Grifola frondosa TaxID=5627 RepID=A0A1C7MIS3_GRIFR|nr:hypothetical protein A0H81_05164 [Grifola frondosa]